MQRSEEGQQTQRTVSGRPSQMQVALPDQNYQDSPRSTVLGRPSQMQDAAPSQTIGRTVRATEFGRPSQMQGGTQSKRYEEFPRSTVARRSSSMQGDPPNPRWEDAPRSMVSGRPSQMQDAAPTQLDVACGAPSTRQLQTQVTSSSQRNTQSCQTEQRSRGAVNNYVNISSPPFALQSINEARASSYSISSRQTQGTCTQGMNRIQPTFVAGSSSSNIQPTFIAARPQSGRTQIIRPGEPHHFGSAIDTYSGSVIVTLCRCSNPYSHGDAYTMLNSPRGYDMNGQPIDWQEGKRRMLDHYGRGTQQISHQQELDAIPYVFDSVTARDMFEMDREIREKIRMGGSIMVNTQGNRTSWHNEDGHAKNHVTDQGAKTVIER